MSQIYRLCVDMYGRPTKPFAHICDELGIPPNQQVVVYSNIDGSHALYASVENGEIKTIYPFTGRVRFAEPHFLVGDETKVRFYKEIPHEISQIELKNTKD